MAKTLRITNFTRANIKEQAQLATDIAVNTSSLTLLNNNNIVNNDSVLIGGFGSEVAEVRRVSSVSGATLITTVNTTFAHYAYDPVMALNGSQIKIYTAQNVNGTAPADAAFSLLATIDMDVDQQETVYIDQTGTDLTWYKYTYYNPDNNRETDLSLSTAVWSGSVSYVSIEEIREEAGFTNNRNITDALIDSKRQIAQAEIDGQLSGRYKVPFSSPINAHIKNIALMLTAGYLLKQQYGTFGTLSTTNGDAKITWAQNAIDAIKSGQTVLTDGSGNDTSIPTTGDRDLGFSGWPNGTTAALSHNELGAGDFMFKRSMIDGYYEREY